MAEKLSEVTKDKIRHSGCAVRIAMDSMTAEDREALETVFSNRSVTVRNIFQVLLDDGYDVAFWHVKEHAAKGCKCFVGGDR